MRKQKTMHCNSVQNILYRREISPTAPAVPEKSDRFSSLLQNAVKPRYRTVMVTNLSLAVQLRFQVTLVTATFKFLVPSQ